MGVETVRIIAHEQENARSRKLGEKTKEVYGMYVYLTPMRLMRGWIDETAWSSGLCQPGPLGRLGWEDSRNESL